MRTPRQAVSGNERLLRLSELSVWLDGYDDIFSDFDPRPYQERALSDDFLAIARTQSRKLVGGGLSLNLLIPQAVRDRHVEKLVRDRLLGHFSRHASGIRREIRRMRRHGILMCTASMLVMLFAAYLPEFGWAPFLTRLLAVICNPGGWYLVFTGLDLVFARPAQRRDDLDFHEKLASCRIVFSDYASSSPTGQ